MTPKQKERITYYAGNIPYLLSIIGHYILETLEEEKTGGKININKIFLDKCNTINSYYNDCIKYLERDGNLKRIVPFIMGPNMGVTKKDRDELFNLGYLREEKGELVAISRYFEDFLSTNMMDVSIWENIINLEKKVKLIVEHEIPSVKKHYEVHPGDKEYLLTILRKNRDIKKRGY